MLPLGLQLHSVRDAAAADLDSVLTRVRAMGYDAVESADLHGLEPTAFRGRCDDAGLALPTAHALAIGDGAAAALDQAAGLGVERVVIPAAGPERFASVSGIQALAADLAASASLASERGLRVGYHNHFWEWQVLEDGGLAYDRLVAELPDDVFLELDLYWAQVAGQAPDAVLRQHGARIELLHVKDGPAEDPGQAMVAVGDGAVPIRAALETASAARCHIVELDRCDTDMFDALERSAAWMRRAGFAAPAAGTGASS